MKPIVFDPRGKILVFLMSCMLTMNLLSFLPLTLFVGFITILLWLSGKVKKGITLFIIYGIGAGVSYWALHLDAGLWAGLLTGIFAFMRLLIPTIMAFTLVFQTTKVSEFMSTFEKLHIPYCVMIPFIVMFRFFPTVQEEWRGIRSAMSFRGIGLGAKGLLLHPIRSTEHIIVPLLFSCVAIMDELVAASLARGLDSDKKRTCYFDIKMKFYDYLVILITLGFASLMFIL